MSNGTQLQITNNTNYTIKNQSVVRMAQYYSIEFKLILTKVRTKWSSIIGDYLGEETGLRLKYALLTTLVHEMAHAFHHVGKYKESKIWNHFNDADDNIVEGLAEYYAWMFVEDYKNEYPEMKITYDYMYQCLSVLISYSRIGLAINIQKSM